MTKDNKTTLLGGVSYDDEPNFDDVLIFDDKDLYRANLLYQYPVFIPVDMGLGKPVPVESPVFVSDNNYSNNNNSFNNTSNVKYVYLPSKNPEQSLDYIKKKGNVKDFGYIPPKQEDIVMKPIKKEKNYDDIAKYFYPDMPDKSQIQESKRTPLLTGNNEPQVKYYDDFPTLADRNYVAKPIVDNFKNNDLKETNMENENNKDNSIQQKEQINTDWIMPCKGRISSPYGWRKSTNSNHTGIDIAVPVGTPIKAIADGKVTVAYGGIKGYGNAVYINHGTINGKTVVAEYGHVSKFYVKIGQQVQRGQIIALSGGEKGAPGSGVSKGPHLHLTIRLDGKHYNPLKYIHN